MLESMIAKNLEGEDRWLRRLESPSVRTIPRIPYAVAREYARHVQDLRKAKWGLQTLFPKFDSDGGRLERIDEVLFVNESLRLSAISPNDDLEAYRIHVGLAKAFLESQVGHISNPAVVNSELLNARGMFQFRSATPMTDMANAVRGNKTRAVAQAWHVTAERLTKQYAEHPHTGIKEIIAWFLHDALVSLKLFRDANERTARLLLQNIRIALGLTPEVVRSIDVKLHQSRLQFFRDELATHLRASRLA